MRKAGHLSRAQRKFLVGFGQGTVVSGEAGWPEAMVLDRWMRNGAFRREFTVRARAIRQEIRLHLLERALEAARQYGGGSAAEASQKGETGEGRSNGRLREFLELIKLWMASERVAGSERTKGEDEEEEVTFEEAALQLAHPSAPPGEVIAFFRRRAEVGRGRV